jgi:hypothetical protein
VVEGWAAEFGWLGERVGPRFAVRRSAAGLSGSCVACSAGRPQEWLAVGRARPRDHPDGMQRLLTTTGWDPMRCAMGWVPMWWNSSVTLPGCWWWTRPASSRRAPVGLGCSASIRARLGGSRTARSGCSWLRQRLRGRALVGRELYLPAEWACSGTPHRGARARAGRLPDQAAAGQQLLARALEAGVPAGWVTADEVYGGDARRRAWLEEQDLAYVLAVKATQPLWAASAQGPPSGPPVNWSLACPPAPGDAAAPATAPRAPGSRTGPGSR